MNFKDIINFLLEGNRLDEITSYELMQSIANNYFNDFQKTAIIIALSSRDIALSELMGFRKALLDLCIRVDINKPYAIDICGTGGDGKDTFNISTISAFVVAASGITVAKHGNYAVTSTVGSSNLLQHIGYKFSNDSEKLKREINECNLCFMHAPLFHPALKNVAEIRKQLGIKTIFNTLGPLVNPARVQYQLVGVNSTKLARLYNYILQKSSKGYAVVYSIDGYDEISLTSDIQVFTNYENENIKSPSDLGFNKVNPESLKGGKKTEEAAKIFFNILSNNAPIEQINVIIANSAFAIKTVEQNKTFEECRAIAEETIKSKKALNLYYKLINLQ